MPNPVRHRIFDKNVVPLAYLAIDFFDRFAGCKNVQVVDAKRSEIDLLSPEAYVSVLGQKPVGVSTYIFLYRKVAGLYVAKIMGLLTT